MSRLLGADLLNFYLNYGTDINGYEALKIGRDVSIQQNCFLSCVGGLTIGDYVSIGHGTSILTTNHSYIDKDVPIKYQQITTSPVIVGSNVWIGAKVTILSGVQIADGTIIAAGAVVTKSILEENIIVGGVPAKFIKRRFD